MLDINLQLYPKQNTAWQYIHDRTTTEILIGGGAGGGKSFLGCAAIIRNCGEYPGTRWLIGRKKLSVLKQTTLVTFFDTCKRWGIKAKKHYFYNINEKTITFGNGSQVILKDLFHYPADPDFNDLGSLEITGAFIDEANQVSPKAIDVVSGRMRYKLDEYGLVPKLIMSCNPDKNYVKTNFYDPWVKGTLPDYRRFVQILARDNGAVSRHYLTQLDRLNDQATRERLRDGNWDYDEDPAALFDTTDLGDVFHLKVNDESKIRLPWYVSVDVARHGKDKTVIRIWHGMQSVKTLRFQGKDTKEITKELEKIEDQYKIPRSHFVVDEDGIGGGVVDQFRGCRGFIARARPIEAEREKEEKGKYGKNYGSLKAQCYFMLSQKIAENELGIECGVEEQDRIKQELLLMKRLNMYDDSKPLEITPKDEIKEAIGRSPDDADTLAMRMIFELGKSKVYNVDEKTVGKSETVAGNLITEKF